MFLKFLGSEVGRAREGTGTRHPLLSQPLPVLFWLLLLLAPVPVPGAKPASRPLQRSLARLAAKSEFWLLSGLWTHSDSIFVPWMDK